MPYIMLRTQETKRGPGFWKFNTSLLKCKEYTEMIKELITKNKAKPFNSIAEKWDYIQAEIRGCYSSLFLT